MTDYLNPHKLYPDNISRRIDIPPGFDSVRPAVKDSLTTALDENGLARCGCGGRAQMVVNGWKEFSAFCPDCGFESAQYPSEEDVKIKWNRSRGIKEGDE